MFKKMPNNWENTNKCFTKYMYLFRRIFRNIYDIYRMFLIFKFKSKTVQFLFIFLNMFRLRYMFIFNPKQLG